MGASDWALKLTATAMLRMPRMDAPNSVTSALATAPIENVLVAVPKLAAKVKSETWMVSRLSGMIRLPPKISVFRSDSLSAGSAPFCTPVMFRSESMLSSKVSGCLDCGG